VTRAEKISSQRILDETLDAGTFESWDQTPEYGQLDAAYREQLRQARERSGVDESVVTGQGRIHGYQVAVVVSEFSFLAGSIGAVAADRIVAAFEKATALGLPVLASPASGGTRMQEGTPAFVAMVRISAAVRAHREAGLPYLVYLRHPTTGGVMASWGSQGHITVAQPGALLGFLGPRVYETMYGEPFPEGVQISENLKRHGLIDAVVPLADLAGILVRALRILEPSGAGTTFCPEPVPDRVLNREEVWNAIEATRKPRRPGVRHFVKYAAEEVLQLSGTLEGETDERMYLALARLRGIPCVIIAQDRGPASGNPLGPAFLREARRGIELAEQLRVPLLTIIDTEGAALSRQAEEGGMAGQISRSISALIGVETHTVSLLLGQGTGGGALALLPADITIAAQNAWLSPLPPEGASAIVYRNSAHAAELAHAQGTDSFSLRRAGIEDVIVPEQYDVIRQPRAFAEQLCDAVAGAFGRLRQMPVQAARVQRQAKYAAVR